MLDLWVLWKIEIPFVSSEKERCCHGVMNVGILNIFMSYLYDSVPVMLALLSIAGAGENLFSPYDVGDQGRYLRHIATRTFWAGITHLSGSPTETMETAMIKT